MDTAYAGNQLFPEALAPLGFSANRSGGHMARSMMLKELAILHRHLPPGTSREEFQQAVEVDNLLGKPTFGSRQKSFRHLAQLYGLDPGLALFRVLRLFGGDDPSALPLVALVCAYCRDVQLRQSFALVESLRPGEILPRPVMEAHLEAGFPDRFSKVMKESLAQHVNTTWTASGHLIGRAVKKRAIPKPAMVGTVYATFAGWLAGLRGETLLNSVFGRLVAATRPEIIAHLGSGSARGWLRLRNAGGVTEIDFLPLLTDRESQLLSDVPH